MKITSFICFAILIIIRVSQIKKRLRSDDDLSSGRYYFQFFFTYWKYEYSQFIKKLSRLWQTFNVWIEFNPITNMNKLLRIRFKKISSSATVKKSLLKNSTEIPYWFTGKTSLEKLWYFNFYWTIVGQIFAPFSSKYLKFSYYLGSISS